MTPKQFLDTYGSDCIIATEGTGLFPSVKLAQMALESGWGEKIIGNNAFGIKADGVFSTFWKGATAGSLTSEIEKDRLVNVYANFRAYDSVKDSIKDHTEFLQQNLRYTAAGVFSAATYTEQAHALQRAGYATDSFYAVKLINIIEKYNFNSLDSKKK